MGTAHAAYSSHMSEFAHQIDNGEQVFSVPAAYMLGLDPESNARAIAKAISQPRLGLTALHRGVGGGAVRTILALRGEDRRLLEALRRGDDEAIEMLIALGWL